MLAKAKPLRQDRRSYRVLQAWGRAAASVWARRLDVTGVSKLRPSEPTVVAANHSNAMGDVAAIAARLPQFPHFLAAASWWRLRPARFLFELGGVIPIHRDRKEGEDPRANISAFAACHDALAGGAHLVIFPEGEVHLEASLRPLKTGAARIALGAAAEGHVAGVRLVPLGIVWEDRERMRSAVELHVGDPIEIDDWLDEYRADPAKTVRAVTNVLADRLAAATVNHGSADEAALVDRAAAYVLADDDGASFADRNALRRRLGAAIALAGGDSSTEYRALEAAVTGHRRALVDIGVGDARALPLVAPSPSARTRLDVELAALTPVAALGFAVNGPWLLAAWGAGSQSRGELWTASVKGLAGTVFAPLVWLGEVRFLSKRLGAGRAAALTACGAIAGLAALPWHDRYRVRRDVRAYEAAAAHPDALDAARATRAELRRCIEALVGATAR